MENSDFTHPFRTLGDNLSYFLAKRGCGDPVKSAFYASRETSWKKQLFENFHIGDLFQTLSENLVARFSNCFYVSKGTVLGSCTFCEKSKFFVVSTHYVKLYRNLKRYWQDCQISIYHLQWNILRTKWSEGKFFQVFTKFGLWAKKLGRVVTSASQASRVTICRRTEFWNDLYFFQFGWMISGRVQNCNLRVQKNVFGDFILKNQFFVLILGLWGKIL